MLCIRVWHNSVCVSSFQSLSYLAAVLVYREKTHLHQCLLFPSTTAVAIAVSLVQTLLTADGRGERTYSLLGCFYILAIAATAARALDRPPSRSRSRKDVEAPSIGWKRAQAQGPYYECNSSLDSTHNVWSRWDRRYSL